MPDVIVGLNSYVTIAEADAYLEGSVQWSTVWAAYTQAEKEVALISAWRQLEREKWAGEKSAVRQIVDGETDAQGTGYAVGDRVQIDGGVGELAIFEVLTIGGSGELATAKLLFTGFYTTDPTTPANTTALTGGGSGATVKLVLSDQVMEWPRTITDCGDLEVEPLVIPADIQAAQCELAAIFAADPSQAGQVGAGSSSASDNIKKVEAGSAKVTYFRPGSSPIYPTVPWQLLSPYREGACGGLVGVGNAAFGTGDVSTFTCPEGRYGLNHGYS